MAKDGFGLREIALAEHAGKTKLSLDLAALDPHFDPGGHLRKLLSVDSFRVVQLDGSQYTDVAEPEGGDYTNLVQLDRSEYTEVR